jgi:hypothetical protein
VSFLTRTSLLLLALSCWFSASPAPGSPTIRPKLAVVIVFDQLRADYLEKWRPYFSNGGFRRLQDEGAWFTNCYYPYARTVTAAGHASLLTGCNPQDHAIVDNGWYDRATGQTVFCVRGDHPKRRQAPTIGDVLSRGRQISSSRQISISMKARSAILMAAASGAQAYWLSGTRFVTSGYYRPAPPTWVDQFNAQKLVAQGIGKPWTRLRSDISYGAPGSDDVAHEWTGSGQGRTFPHPTPDLEAFENSPAANELLAAFARAAISAEKLGQHAATDLLCISFSANDKVGHCFGPDSQEVQDITLRSDLIVKDLLELFDRTVGKGNYVVCITADHGVCPIPGVAKAQGKDAGFVDSSTITAVADQFLKRHGAGRKVKATDELNLYVENPTDAIDTALAHHLATQPGIQAVYTRAQLLSSEKLADPTAEMMRLSSHPESCGDVVLLQKPYYLILTPTTPNHGTNHGTPYDYDTHVPLLALGPGIRPGTYKERVAPQAICFILQHVLNIAAPAKARLEFSPPREMWR